MAEDSNNGDRKIISLGEIQEQRRKVSRQELDKDLTELSFAILERQQRTEDRVQQLEQVLRAHQKAIAILDVRSVAGRIRRAKVSLAAWRELFRGYAIELGVLRPPAPRPDLDNPEAMPKP